MRSRASCASAAATPTRGSVRRQKACGPKAAKEGCDGAEARLMKAGGYLIKPRWGLGPPMKKQKGFTVLRSIIEIRNL